MHQQTQKKIISILFLSATLLLTSCSKSDIEVKEYKELKGHTADVWSVIFSPDGKTLASGSTDKSVMLWNTETGKRIGTFQAKVGVINTLSYSPDGKMLAVSGGDSVIRIWELNVLKRD